MRKIFLSLAISLLAGSGFVFGPAQASAASQPKVVIVVGATHGTTSSYRSDADSAYKVFLRYTSNVVRIYSPNATWSAVSAAAKGANILLYLGHGNGQPSPYHTALVPSSSDMNSVDGMGLNATAGAGDSNTKYYGETYMQTLGLAPNAVVLLWHLCYASGDSEWGKARSDPATFTKATHRVDNFAAGFIRGGARAVIADGVIGDISPYITGLFTAHTTVDKLWKSAPNFHNHVTSWSSTRNAGFVSQIDPNLDHPEADGDVYYRSMVAAPGLLTDDVVGPMKPLPTWIVRYGGTSRFDTAATVARKTFSPGVGVAYVANAWNFPDALAGAAAAGTLPGPVLLADDVLPIDAATTAALTALQPKKIVVLGGTGAISDDVAKALGAYTTGGVVRYGGATRFEAAANVATGTFPPPIGVAYVANAYGFPDALAGAAAAGTVKGPVLLVSAAMPIGDATVAALTKLRPQKIVVLGGTGVVSPEVETALAKYSSTGTVVRYGGTDRFDAAAMISSKTFATGVAAVYIANAYNFPDALAGAAAAGTVKGPVLLADTSGVLDDAIAREIVRLNPKQVVLLGGPGAVPDATGRAIAALFPNR